MVTHSALDGELFTSHLVTNGSGANSLSVLLGIKLLVQLGDLDMVGHDGTVLDSCQNKRDTHSGIVVLSWR